MALCPAELLVPLCLLIKPSHLSGIRPALVPTALVGNRKSFIHRFLLTTQQESEDGGALWLCTYRQMSAWAACRGGQHVALPFPSTGNTSVLGSWGALRHPDVRG